MKYSFIFFFLILIQIKSIAQTNPKTEEPVIEERIITTDDFGDVVAPPPIDEDNNQIFSFVEENAQFPGGENALFKYLLTNITYPKEASDSGISGKVYVRFVVETNGTITGIEVLRGVHPLLDKEALRVVKSMPNWSPAKQNGKAVRVYYTLPINFNLK